MLELNGKIMIRGELKFHSGFHLGAGERGQGASDKSILRRRDGKALLPGSSLKGVFRSTAERLAHHLGQTACFLEAGDGDDPVRCASGDRELAEKVRDDLTAIERETGDAARGSGARIAAIVAGNTCQVCKLFGSPIAAGRIQFTDAVIADGAAVEVRDGVSLDRDSRTARPKLKYDFEVVPSGARFPFKATVDNPSSEDRALTWAVLLEWRRGVKLGALASRGLGDCTLDGLAVQEVRLTDPASRLRYLLDGEGEAVTTDTMRRELEAAVKE